ncbi:MAG: 23S rRNA (adenine(2503)-C(2))-methyltransferase RlmN [Myxococcales bacterium]|nr:23S rRNA (adenine(2503)-C(2))-methyltransferase RlmN [Myxococcales bacterium]USN51319.1 MAG: 23S rRNA (adenine(2503)-C(2))-methyltransferase RlmN [Myxococcales bacterium]
MSTATLAKDLRSLLPSELEPLFFEIQEPKYKSKQLFQALHRQGINSLDDALQIKKSTRDYLAQHCKLAALEQTLVKVSSDGTRKYQFKTHDGHTIESVFIPHAAKQGRHSLCISSQVGCAMGCTFCATAALKLVRNLDASEIVAQVYNVAQDVMKNGNHHELMLSKNERPIHNIVFMGMGEPLHNFNNLVRAIELLTHQDGMAFSPRRITVSTSGIVPKIKELGEKTGVYLAVSLNATTNEIRNIIMPVNNKWHIEELLKACRDFPLKIRERITFEYVLLKGINDNQEDAHRLAHLLKDMQCKINLIPFNEHPLSPYKKPDNEVTLMFHKILYRAHLSVFTRKTRGDDIDAACGMLGAKKLESKRSDISGSVLKTDRELQ